MESLALACCGHRIRRSIGVKLSSGGRLPKNERLSGNLDAIISARRFTLGWVYRSEGLASPAAPHLQFSDLSIEVLSRARRPFSALVIERRS